MGCAPGTCIDIFQYIRTGITLPEMYIYVVNVISVIILWIRESFISICYFIIVEMNGAISARKGHVQQN